MVAVTGFKNHPDASVGVKSHFARENRLHSCDLKQVESTITSAKNKRDAEASLLPLVGVTGFEPAASWSRTMRTTKLCHTPIIKLKFSVGKSEISFDSREVPNRFGRRKATKGAYIPNCCPDYSQLLIISHHFGLVKHFLAIRLNVITKKLKLKASKQ